MKTILVSVLSLASVLAGGNLCGQPVADTNLFPVAAGTYAGLFYETNEVHHEYSGWLLMTVTRSGTYSGRIILGAKSSAFSGGFLPDGTVTQVLRMRSAVPIEMTLKLETNTAQISGMFSNAAFVAVVLTDKILTFSETNPCPWSGRYTLLIDPAGDGVSAPAGVGYGVATVGSRGTVKLLGALPDGRVITQSAYVSGSGVWPLYERLYGNRGSLLGWVNFEDRPTNDFHGLISWIRPGMKGMRVHSGGFATDATVTGSRYAAPTTVTNMVLNLTNGIGIVACSGGSVTAPFTNEVMLLPRARVSNQSSNRLQMNFNLPWGRFVGTVREPGSGALHHFKGAVLQKANHGAGYFIDKHTTGRVYLGPAPEPQPAPELTP